jgi:DNA (cytosine-5)-methyltransferase 1
MGYAEAGFRVVGVDNKPQPRYPFEFHLGDALDFADRWGRFFAVVHASPPCQVFCAAATTRARRDHPDLLPATRAVLRELGRPYVIENVPTAPMPTGVLLCGSTFGLPIVRHRRFEVAPDPVLVPSMCPQSSFSRSVDHGEGYYPYATGSWEPAWREHVLPAVWPWMTLLEAGQAVPPAYTRYLGEQLAGAL